MRLEQLPLVLAVVVGLLGAVLLADAVLDDEGRAPLRERRRRVRAERHRWGEALLGLGLLACTAAIAGRDGWRYGTVAMFAGVALLVVGTALNSRLLRELLVNRGMARRQPERDPRGPEVARRHPESRHPESRHPESRHPESGAGDRPEPPLRLR